MTTIFPETITDEDLPAYLYKWQAEDIVIRFTNPDDLDKAFNLGYRTFHLFWHKPDVSIELGYGRDKGKAWTKSYHHEYEPGTANDRRNQL